MSFPEEEKIMSHRRCARQGSKTQWVSLGEENLSQIVASNQPNHEVILIQP